ncbi:unnamed protein product [Rotaria sordida]|uniref:Reverse transcriptase/retrotransposon-derived protein RNase H-like domain-containing protein n=1 Tax=Rotaria sordida TaxID=392033 RepID=A0A815PJ04_9BILA|nr:unnamed protein product [Rotaria sordida]
MEVTLQTLGEDKIKSILLLPELKSLAEANHFIGTLSWYRKFIPNFTSIAVPIHIVTNLPKPHRYKFKWEPKQSKSFKDLKQLLTSSSPLLLNFLDDTHPILLSTDASNVSIGGVLYQEINNVKKILYYHSELLSSSQKSYHPIELDTLAILKWFTRDKSSSLQLFNAVVTRSKSKVTSTNIISSSSPQQPQTSSDSSSFSSAISNHSSYLVPHFDIIELKEHQNNDIQIQKMIKNLK